MLYTRNKLSFSNTVIPQYMKTVCAFKNLLYLGHSLNKDFFTYEKLKKMRCVPGDFKTVNSTLLQNLHNYSWLVIFS